MARRAKTGKARQDKYYHLAKEQGYRARSAFKLIQLAQKCDIFRQCQSLLDLCAAPGGWLQVARKQLPLSATIVGVDLAPIAPIRGVTTIQADITTDRCQKLLTQELPHGQCDVVLHDGAPNVGADWSRDAFVQNELVLHSLRLAARFLRKGGVFVSKVFRSRDWVSLLWVFEQLFERVTPTKPSSSRDVSAEIFVICEGYKAPAKVDPKFFDVRHVFVKTEAEEAAAAAADGQTGTTAKLSLKTMMKMASKKNRSGYDSDSDVHRPGSVTDFFHAPGSGAPYLVRFHTLAFPRDDAFAQRVKNHPQTTEDIREYCKDLRVCGLSEKTALVKWRQKILIEWAQEEKKRQADQDPQSDPQSSEQPAADQDPQDPQDPALTPEERDELIQREIIALHEKDSQLERKESRKLRKQERKQQIRRAFAAAAYGGGVQEEPDLFSFDKEKIEHLEKNEDALVANLRCHLLKDAPSEQESDVDPESDGAASSDEEDESPAEAADDVQLEELLAYGPDQAAQIARVSELAVEAAVRHELERERTGRNALAALSKKEKKTRRQKVYAEWAAEMADFANTLEAQNFERLKQGAVESDDGDDDSEGEAGDLSRLQIPAPSDTQSEGGSDADAEQEEEKSEEEDESEGEDEEEEEEETDGEEEEDGQRFVDDEAEEETEDHDDDSAASSASSASAATSASSAASVSSEREEDGDASSDVPEYRYVEKVVKRGKKKASGEQLPATASQALMERFYDQPLFKDSGITLESLIAADKAAAAAASSDDEEEQLNRRVKPGVHVAASAVKRPAATYHSDTESTTDDGDKSLAEDAEIADELSDSELPALPLTEKQKRRQKRQRDAERRAAVESRKRRRQAEELSRLGGALPEDDPNLGKGGGGSKFEVVPRNASSANAEDLTAAAAASAPKKPKSAHDLAVVHAIGALLARRNTRLDLVDGAYHRYAFDDDPAALPEWLVEDEAEAMMPELPVSKDVVKQYEEKWREIEARPIRKVLEAKARRQKRLKEKLEQVRRKAESIAESPEFDERTKAKTIRQMMSKITRQSKPANSYKVMTKSGARTVGGSKQGGRVKVVDRRLKKDKRAAKARGKKRRR